MRRRSTKQPVETDAVHIPQCPAHAAPEHQHHRARFEPASNAAGFATHSSVTKNREVERKPVENRCRVVLARDTAQSTRLPASPLPSTRLSPNQGCRLRLLVGKS